MPPATAGRSAAYREYAALLRQLHASILAGFGESPEGDDLRDALDGPWHRMNPEEVEVIDALSADLDTLGRDAGAGAPSEAPEDAEAGASLLRDSRWIAALDWVRSAACTR